MLGTRFYDPEAGVFTQRDKAKDGLSYYAYTSGQVMTAVDPWGHKDAWDCHEQHRMWTNRVMLDFLNCAKSCAAMVGVTFVVKDQLVDLIWQIVDELAKTKINDALGGGKSMPGYEMSQRVLQ